MGYEVLFNFISPVTGRILCDPDKILVGDANGIAIPSLFIPIGALPDLPMGNIWIGNDMNRPTPNATITTDNLPNLSSGKVWIGNGMFPSRPVEGTPPQGPAGPPGPAGNSEDQNNNLANNVAGNAAGSLVKFGLEKLFSAGVEAVANLFKIGIGISIAANTAISLADTIIDGIALNKDRKKDTINYTTLNIANNSLIGARGAEGLSITPTFIIASNLSIEGGRLENISPSPQADYDAVAAKWVWDLLNDNVEIIWAN